MLKPVIVWGASGHAKVLSEFLDRIGYDLVAVFDNDPTARSPFPGVPLRIGREGFKYMPGSRIPIVDEAHLQAHQPDRILILPWNLRQEVMAQLGYVREWDGQFVTAVPTLAVTKGISA